MDRNHPLCRPFACLLSAIGSLLVPCCTTAFGQNLVTQPAAQAPAVRPIPALPTPGTPPHRKRHTAGAPPGGPGKTGIPPAA